MRTLLLRLPHRFLVSWNRWPARGRPSRIAAPTYIHLELQRHNIDRKRTVMRDVDEHRRLTWSSWGLSWAFAWWPHSWCCQWCWSQVGSPGRDGTSSTSWHASCSSVMNPKVCRVPPGPCRSQAWNCTHPAKEKGNKLKKKKSTAIKQAYQASLMVRGWEPLLNEGLFKNKNRKNTRLE